MPNGEAHLSKQRGYTFLQGAFALEQECLLSKLKSSDRIVHCGDRGEVNEQLFIDLFRSYLPNRYTVEKAIVLDSKGNVSDSIDIVVFDRQYTPTLLDSDNHRYVPAEAVYAVFECKPTVNKQYLEYAARKAASVRRLKRTSVPIQHAGGTYPAKKHFEIVSGILAVDVEWTDGFGDTFKKTHSVLTGEQCLDCGLAASGVSYDIFDDDRSYRQAEGQNALVFFLFRLLNKLQSLGTVPATDWNAYAAALSNTPIEE